MPISSSPFRIISFCCQNAISGERDLAGKGRVLLEPAVKIIALPCSSKIETLGIIKAFESGVDGIFVIGCPDDKCHLLGGNYRARKIIKYTKRLLEEIGIESSRLEMFQLGTSECQDFDRAVRSMNKRIESLGQTTLLSDELSSASTLRSKATAEDGSLRNCPRL